MLEGHLLPLVVYDMEQKRHLKKIENMMKSIQGQGHYGRVSYKDLCLFSGISKPPKFKMLEFEKYGGIGNPVVHLHLYTDKMEEYIESSELFRKV